jgi:hypothetical protein
MFDWDVSFPTSQDGNDGVGQANCSLSFFEMLDTGDSA